MGSVSCGEQSPKLGHWSEPPLPADTSQRRHIFLGRWWFCPCPTTAKASISQPTVKRRALTWPAQPWAPLLQTCRWTSHLDLNLGAAQQWDCPPCPALPHCEALPCCPRGKAPAPHGTLTLPGAPRKLLSEVDLATGDSNFLRAETPHM